MQNSIELPVEYRIDLSPEEVGLALSGSDKRDTKVYDEYSQLAARGLICGIGNILPNGDLVHTNIGAQEYLERFFPDQFDSSMPYRRMVLSEPAVAVFMETKSFAKRRNNGRNGGDIFDVGTGFKDGRHIIFFPAFGNNYRATQQSNT